MTTAALGEQPDGPDWLEVTLPGDVHTELVAAGRLDEPDAADSESTWAWVAEREWWYRLQAPMPAVDEHERVLLHLEGLDTYADVYVNGVHVATSADMFLPLDIDLTAHASGEDTVVPVQVRLRPPLAEIGPVAPVLGIDLLEGPRTRMRKAQFGFGWDFAPDRPSVGIWRPVSVSRQRVATLTGVHAATVSLAADSRSAVVRYTAEIDHFADFRDQLDVEFVLLDPDGAEVLRLVAPAVGQVGGCRADAASVVLEPRLWWPHGSGSPELHTLRTTLRDGEQELCRREQAFGIRTVTLDESADPGEPGARFFRFVVNGRPIYAKGSNWVPCTTAVGAVPEDRVRTLLTLARDAGMNMLRIWGGGVYESNEFYDCCDELGLLVWQEFGFACASYPQDDAFCALVEAEARALVRRLRAHPCLALWCGNNEVEMIAQLLPLAMNRADRIFYDVLPRAVRELDGSTAYRASSPSFPEDRQQGDRHVWEVWHGFGDSSGETGSPLSSGQTYAPGSEEAAAYLRRIGPERYRADSSRFASEFGLLSGPTRETYAGWIGPLTAPVDADVLAHRLRDRIGPANKLALVAEQALGRLDDMGDLLDGSHLAQAEGLTIAVGHYRRRWPQCGGTLIWQLDDCWPGFSWSLLDVDTRPKPAYYAVRRAYAPIALSFAPEPDGGMAVWAVNETGAEHVDRLTIRLRTFGGRTLLERHVDVQLESAAEPVVLLMPEELTKGGGDLADRYLRVTSESGTMAPARHVFADYGALQRTPADAAATHSGAGLVTLTSEAYVFAAHLSHPDPAVCFSDSYVDVEPGEPRAISVAAPGAYDPGALILRCW